MIRKWTWQGQLASLIFVFVLLVAAPCAFADQQTFVAVKDNTIYEESNNSNGQGARLIVGKYEEGEAVSFRRALLQFDLSSIPTNAVITDVRLEVWVDAVEFISAQDQTLQLHRLNQDWGEGASNDGGGSWSGVAPEPGDATWNHRFYDSQLWEEPGGDYISAWSSHASFPANAAEALVGFPQDFSPVVWLVEDVQLWVNHPETNFGWIMHSDFSSATRALAVSSREEPLSIRRPRLTVHWSFPDEEEGLSLDPVASNLNWPVGVTNAGDGSGRLFVIEQDGVIKIHDPVSGLLETPFLDISSSVLSPVDGGHVEQGLLGLAFHPDFPQTHQFFVNYTYDPPGENLNRTRVSRFSVSEDPNVAMPDETVIMEFEQDDDNNNGGDLRFGPDGNLYIATGDGGGVDDQYGNALSLYNPKAKILRINVDGVGETPESCEDVSVQNYTTPSDAFYSRKGDGCDEILLHGFRNPWRFNFDPRTGFMYIGDQGQDQFEEIHVVQVADGFGSYGWSCAEGRVDGPTGIDSCPFLFSIPQAEYPPSSGHCDVIGGVVYRGTSSALHGKYVYGDRCSGTIWFAEYRDSWLWPNRWDDPGQEISTLASFGQDEQCEIHVVDRGESENSGVLYRIDTSQHLKRSGFETYDCR